VIDGHPLISRTAAFIHKERLIDPGCALCVGVSGGADSVALLHLLADLKETLEIRRITLLHFNHRLRGEASDADQAFVTSLAERMGMECLVGGEDVRGFAAETGVSLEMAGRMCRHRFFQEALATGSGDGVALAHTANDQAEEALLRLFRGTGPSGMAGMPPKTARGIVRPLLFAWRRDVLEYLEAGGHSFREDASNAVPSCQRNVLRLELLPLIERRFHGKVADAVVRHAELVRDEESWWEGQIQELWGCVCREHSQDRLVLDCGGLNTLHPALLRRLLRHGIERFQGHLQRIYAVHVEALQALACGSGGTARLDLPGRLRAVREGTSLILSCGGAEPGGAPSEPPLEATFNEPGEYRVSGWEWTLREAESGGENPGGSTAVGSDGSAFEAHMDADRLFWPLRVRSWLPGDRFVPLGLAATKKLQDFFVDAKVERNRRRQIPLLCDREKICWVAGLRLDDRVKVTPLTRRVLVVRLRSRSQIPNDAVSRGLSC
jgi:tRNA(Ile)-lysidine synthase